LTVFQIFKTNALKQYVSTEMHYLQTTQTHARAHD